MATGTTVRMWRRTLMILIVLIAIGFGAVIVSLIRLQLIDGQELQQRAISQQLKDTSINAQRGTIYDCNMKPLAQSASVWTVVLEPAYIEDDDTRALIAKGLAGILGKDEQDLLEHTKKETAYDVIARKVESDVKEEILKFKDENDITNGIRLIEDYKRYYTYGTLASSVLGFTGTDNNGLAGLEAYYDSYLSGVQGRLVTAKNAIGTDMPFEYEQMVEAQNGYGLVLTIDEVVQHILEKNLEQGIEDNLVQNRATAVVMNVNTGEIVGLAVKGDYDPNDPFTIADATVRAQVESLPEDQQDEAYSAALQAQWRNKAVSDTYYPGSVFKMVTGSMALEEGTVTETTQFNCTGSVTVIPGTNPIKCWNTLGHGSETFVEGLCNSCNPVFIAIGQKLGPDLFFKYFEAFGLTQRTGIDLPGEAGSLFYTAEKLNPIELATESFGQNFSITPIQMVTAAAAVANGGYIVQPHVVSQIIDDGQNIVESIDTTQKRQVVSEDVSRRMCAILQQNATTGSAKNGYVAGYRIAGKTGTSEKVNDYYANGQVKMEYIASYCGFAPAEDPEYVLLVFFDEPQGDSYYGSAVAGPVFARIMEEILPYLGVQAQYTEEELQKLDSTTPGVTGKSLNEAKTAIDNAGLSVKVYGDGDTVLKQIPEEGKSIPKNGTVVLYTDDTSQSKTVTVPNLIGLTLSEANSTAINSGLNISITGAALTSQNAISSSQSIEAGEEVEPGTVITVGFIEKDTVL